MEMRASACKTGASATLRISKGVIHARQSDGVVEGFFLLSFGGRIFLQHRQTSIGEVQPSPVFDMDLSQDGKDFGHNTPPYSLL